MSSKTLIQGIFEAATFARAIPAVGQAVTRAAGTAVGAAVADKALTGTEEPVAEVAAQDAPVRNAGGAQNLQQNPQNPAGTNQAVAPAQQPVAPKPGDANFDNTRLAATQNVQATNQQAPAQQTNVEVQNQQSQQQLDQYIQSQAQANLLRNLAGVNESGFVSGLRKRIFRRG